MPGKTAPKSGKKPAAPKSGAKKTGKKQSFAETLTLDMNRDPKLGSLSHDSAKFDFVKMSASAHFYF